MSDFKALAKHSTNYLFATMATKALAFISIPVYTRLLSVYELSVLSFYQVLILFVLVIAITVLNLKKILWNEGLYKFYNIFAFLSIFILLNLNQTELSTRFYVFIWLFLPYFIIPFSKNIPLAMLKGIIVMVWIIFFIYVNTNAYYIYKAAPYLLSYSIFNYL